MKKLLLVLSLFILLVFPSLSRANAMYLDVQSPLLTDAVYRLSRNQIVKGYPDLTFRPDSPITRAEALKMVFRVGDRFPLRTHHSASFPDVSEADWFEDYVATAEVENIIRGYPDGTFRPHDQVNRVEFVKMALSNLSGFYLLVEQEPLFDQYADLDPEAWYLPFLAYAHEHDYLDKTPSFRPTEPMTRGEAALILTKILHERDQKSLEKAEKDWEIALKHGALDCETCAGSKDLSEFPWIDSPHVTLRFGRLTVDGLDLTRDLDPLCRGCIKFQIEEAERRHTSLEKKFQVDQLYPEHYRRATGMKGGTRQLGKYITSERTGHIIFNADGLDARKCDCEIEEEIVGAFNDQQIPVFFEDWIVTREAKPFIYDTIDRWLKAPYLNE